MRRREIPTADEFERAVRADEALTAARKLPHGPARNEALKEAGRLRAATAGKDFQLPRRGRPPK
jgi:hypothetical protein